jgi:predicted nucleotide-binding protein (sugar kinase/HSP70/actin superfamily)
LSVGSRPGNVPLAVTGRPPPPWRNEGAPGICVLSLVLECLGTAPLGHRLRELVLCLDTYWSNQEVIASAEVVRQLYPQVKTLLDIGGEDAKLIFFDGGQPGIRLNGACAGGTGAFIDQMATLLNVPVAGLNALAEQHSAIYTIASRCGVFAKYENIPVVTLSTRLQSFGPQPEFKLNLAEYVDKALLGMAYTDVLSALHHAVAVRERFKGDAHRVADKWLVPFETGRMPLTWQVVLSNLRQAVADFGRLALRKERLRRVGVVGEIYVKYNLFVNSHIVQWLMDQELEVILPPLLAFFLGSIVGLPAGVQARIRRPDSLSYLVGLGHKYVQTFLDEAEAILRGFRYYPIHRPITDIAQTAAPIVHLTHQYGEGWLLSGEVGEFVRAGVQHVLCLQPFGCIANHVIAKGVARRLKTTYPELNLLYLDLDARGSEVNLTNRAHFFVEQARQSRQTL